MPLLETQRYTCMDRLTLFSSPVHITIPYDNIGEDSDQNVIPNEIKFPSSVSNESQLI